MYIKNNNNKTKNKIKENFQNSSFLLLFNKNYS